MQRIAILGSTGSIGRQTLNVIEKNPNLFRVAALTANNNFDLLYNQACKFSPDYIALSGYVPTREQIKQLKQIGVEFVDGDDCLEQICSLDEVDTVVYSTVGFSCLKAVIKGIQAHKRICLANKETLVTAGEEVMRFAKKNGVSIYPIDSEHSAILQCLQGRDPSSVERLIITASGGAFRDFKPEELENVKASDALKHPNWEMGNKITIDCATMINKAFEIIEAHYLFGVPTEKIDYVIHRQSVIHSMVEFCDGSVIAQMGTPTMEIPVTLALTYPERIKTDITHLDFCKISELSFVKLDRCAFPCFDLCLKAFERGGLYPTIVNACNDVLVDEFLHDTIKFTEIPRFMETALNNLDGSERATIESVTDKNSETRKYMYSLLKKTYN